MKLYLKYFSIHLRSAMQYKVSFFLTSIGQLLTSFGAFLALFFMFNLVEEVDGFTYQEVLICFAVVLTAYSIAECFFRGFDLFPSMIGNGEFDRILVRPRNEIFQVLGSKIELTRIGRLLQSLLMAIYAFAAGNFQWSLDKALVILLMVICGIVYFAALFLLAAAICFFTIDTIEFMNILTDGGREFGKYPLSIFGEGVLKFFTFVFPMACFQYYPFLYLIGRSDSLLHMLSPLFSLLFILPCYGFWRFGVRRYKSTGS